MDHLRRTLGFVCVFLLVLALGGSVAHGQVNNDAVQKVTALNKKALDKYAQGDFGAARSLLTEALELCNTAGLEKHPIKARTHIHLGIVSIVGFRKNELGMKHFRKAVEIQPEIKLTKSLATPELQEMFDQASGAPGEGGSAPAAGSAPAGGDEGGGAPAGGEADNGGGAPAAAADSDEEGTPTPRIRRAPPKKVKKKKAEAEEEEGGDEDEEGASYKVYIAFAAGSGIGLATGNGELNTMHVLKAAGFAPAQLGQISPEVGFFINKNLMLSARLRIQYVTGINGEMVGPTNNSCGSDMFCSPGNWGIAGFARATYFFGDPGAFRLFLAGELGGGNIRHVETFPGDTNCAMAAGGSKFQCVDSLKSGPFFFGPAVGFLWDLGQTAGIIASVASDVGVGTFTLNFDVNAGVALHF